MLELKLANEISASIVVLIDIRPEILSGLSTDGPALPLAC